MVFAVRRNFGKPETFTWFRRFASWPGADCSQLQLTGFGGIGEKGEAAAVGDQADSLSARGVPADAVIFRRRSLAGHRGGEDCGVAGFRAVLVAKFFDPGDFFAVGRYHSLSEATGSAREWMVVHRGRDFLFLDVAKGAFRQPAWKFSFLVKEQASKPEIREKKKKDLRGASWTVPKA